MGSLAAQRANQKTMSILADYIDENHARRVTLRELAQIAHMNATYVSEVFKRERGESYAEYLIGVRIRHAALLLRTTDEKVSCIGRMVGYPRETSFRRAFRRHMCFSPAEYRQRYRVVSAYTDSSTADAAQTDGGRLAELAAML